jgi:outer membrane receptor protein involved in Fe transport
MSGTRKERRGAGRMTYALPNKNRDISLWANNIANQVYYTYMVDTTNELAAPRTFGAQVAVKC